MAEAIKIVSKNFHKEESHTLRVYLEGGGYEAIKKVLRELEPSQVIDIVKASGLRGRGGAGFPAGVKWGFIPKVEGPKFLAVNADEGEPGTFKDRAIMLHDPHLLIEGILICCYATGLSTVYIYVRGEFSEPAKVMQGAIDEAYGAGYLGKNILGSDLSVDCSIHMGAGAYICGEETALLESLEGKRGQPRLKPPFPALVGLYRRPTVINNVETLSNLPEIILKGPEWYASIGTEKSTGTRLFALSGHVKRPGVYELPMTVTLRELIYEHGGGIREDRGLKAVIPGGSSTPVLTAEEIDVGMDFESLAAAGTMAGSGGVIVMDETVCMVGAALRIVKFYRHESCGQCTPCREGCHWMYQILGRMERGKGQSDEPDLLMDICDNIEGISLCPLGDAVAMPVRSIVKKFREEFMAHIEERRCPLGRPYIRLAH